jgi:hypothetical protein
VKSSGMAEKNHARVLIIAPLVLSGLALSGCMGSPTYGTAKTANEQLVDDMTGVLSLAPKNKNNIDYKPRPELVKPAPGEKETLPPPQEAVAAADNPAWPESPEQRLARIRATATENRDNPGFEPEVASDLNAPASGPQLATGESWRTVEEGVDRESDPKKQRVEFKKRLDESRQGSPTTRKYLSEPPIAYRAPSEAAPVGELGEDEVKKERRLKAAARKKSGGSWWDWVPGL